jgi:hypothetical protein
MYSLLLGSMASLSTLREHAQYFLECSFHTLQFQEIGCQLLYALLNLFDICFTNTFSDSFINNEIVFK